MPSSRELEPHPFVAQSHGECFDSGVAVEPLSWHQEMEDSKSTCRPVRSIHAAASHPNPIEVKMAPVQAVKVMTTTRISRSCPSPDSSYCSSPRSSGTFPASAKPELADASPAVFEGPHIDCVPLCSRASLLRPGPRRSPADVIPKPRSSPSSAVFPQLGAGSAGAQAFVECGQLGPRAPVAGSPGSQPRSSPRQVPRLELDSMPEGELGEIHVEQTGSVAQSPDWSERTCSPHFGARQTIGVVEDVIAGVLAN